jgi:hypothetical protein
MGLVAYHMKAVHWTLHALNWQVLNHNNLCRIIRLNVSSNEPLFVGQNGETSSR